MIDIPLNADQQQYLKSAVAGNLVAASQLVDTRLARGDSALSVYLDLLAIVQRRVGDLWERGELSVAEEHMVTEATLSQMDRLRPMLAPTQRHKANGVKDDDEILRALPGLTVHDLMLLPTERTRDFIDRVEIERLVTQMDAGVGRELRPGEFDRVEHPPRVVGAAQARLPRPGHRMEDGGDAVAHRLAVAVDQRDVDGEIDARPRHHLALEGVAVDIDDARKHHQTFGIERAAWRPIVADRGNRSR